MNDLFEIPESKSPERQWIDLAKMFGIVCESKDGDHWATYKTLTTYGSSDFDAIEQMCVTSRVFPTFDEWKLRQSKAQK